MFERIWPDGMIEWRCHNTACAFHEVLLTARVEHSTVRYVCADPSGAGAVIMLPTCICGSHMDIKADYSRADLLYGRCFIQTPYGLIMKLEHMRGLLLHHLIFLAGKAPRPPILALPSRQTLRYLRELGASVEMAMTVWFTHATIGDQMIAVPGLDQRMLQPGYRLQEIKQ